MNCKFAKEPAINTNKNGSSLIQYPGINKLSWLSPRLNLGRIRPIETTRGDVEPSQLFSCFLRLYLVVKAISEQKYQPECTGPALQKMH